MSLVEWFENKCVKRRDVSKYSVIHNHSERKEPSISATPKKQEAIEGDIIPGDRCRDKISGFTGICICKSFWLNGCVRITLESECLKSDGEIPKSNTFDIEQLDLLAKQVVTSPYEELKSPIDEPVIPQPAMARHGGPCIAPEQRSDPER